MSITLIIFQENGAQSESDDGGDNGSEEAKADDFDYLMSMPMWSLTLERKDDLLKKKNEKKKELNDLKATSKEDLWRMDLKEFIQKLDEMEKKKQEEEEKASGKLNKKKDGGRKKAMPMSPAVKGIRILPTISSELKKKASAAIEKKEKKSQKDAFGKSLKDKMAEFDEPDEFDEMADDKAHNRSLSDRLGFKLKAEEKPKKPKSKPKTTPPKSKAKGKKPWDDSGSSNSDDSISAFSGSESDSGSFVRNGDVIAKERPGRERKTTSYKFEEENSDSNQGMNGGNVEKQPHNGNTVKNESSSDSEDSDIKEMRKMPAKQAKINTMFSSVATTKKESKSPESDNAFDSLVDNKNLASTNRSPIKPNGSFASSKNGSNPYETDSDDDRRPKNGGVLQQQKQSSPKNSNYMFSDDSDDSRGDIIAKSSSEDEFIPSKKKAVQNKKKKVDVKVNNVSFRCVKD